MEIWEDSIEDKIKALLNLRGIKIFMTDGYSSDSCSGRCMLYIDCKTEHGYAEDPDFEDLVIKVLKTERKGDKVILQAEAEFELLEED